MANGGKRNQVTPNLEAGGTAGDAIEGAIKEVEDFHTLSLLDMAGSQAEEVELDAAYLDGYDV